MAPDEVRLGFTREDVVIVTGAASGIGKATAISAAAVGLRVAAWDLNRDGAEATAAEIRDRGGNALAVGADVTDDGQVQAALDASEASLGAAPTWSTTPGRPAPLTSRSRPACWRASAACAG